jgi:hypothetical protein
MLGCGFAVFMSSFRMFPRCIMVAGLVVGRRSVMLLGGFVMALGCIHVMFRSGVFYGHLFSPLNLRLRIIIGPLAK